MSHPVRSRWRAPVPWHCRVTLDCKPGRRGQWARLVALVAALAMAAYLSARTIDRNGNGMSEIWELIYAAANLPPNGDADGDGVSNLGESIAGTNPCDANSVPRIGSVACSGTNVRVSLSCALGKQYQLQ